MDKPHTAIERHTVRTTTTTHRIVLDKARILHLLDANGVTVPINATVTFNVPRGGSYSGDTLDIDSGTPVQIEWTDTTIDEC